MKKVIKIFSIIFFISGLAGILIVKNISYQKEMYINNLEVELRNENNKNQVNEISAIEWFNNEEASQCLRPYYNEKKEIINKTFKILNQINNDCEIVSL